MLVLSLGKVILDFKIFFYLCYSKSVNDLLCLETVNKFVWVQWMVRWMVQCGGVVCKPILVFSLTQAEQLLTKGKAQENRSFLWQFP